MVSAGVVLVFLGMFAFLFHLVMSDNGGRRKDRVSTVTLLKPPPTPEVKEKPPEPEIRKEPLKTREVIATPEQLASAPRPADNQPQGPAPAGGDLGVDAQGGSGSDGFGLVGRKGGRPLIVGGGAGGSGGGGLSLFAKFSWYTQKIQNEIRDLVKKSFEGNGGFPRGKLRTVVKIVLDEKGRVLESRLVGSSGNPSMDRAVLQTLDRLRLSQPPPADMPKGMTLRITSEG
jgi:TonB family protein